MRELTGVESAVLELAAKWERQANPPFGIEHSEDEAGRLASATEAAAKETLERCSKEMSQLINLLRD